MSDEKISKVNDTHFRDFKNIKNIHGNNVNFSKI